MAERDEHGTCVDLLKHYATIQFAQFSVFVAFMTASVAFLTRRPPDPTSLSGCINAGILLVAIGFFVMNVSHAVILNNLLARAVKLEGDLGYEALGKVPLIQYSWFRPTSIVLVFVSFMFVVFAFANLCGCVHV